MVHNSYHSSLKSCSLTSRYLDLSACYSECGLLHHILSFWSWHRQHLNPLYGEGNQALKLLPSNRVALCGRGSSDPGLRRCARRHAYLFSGRRDIDATVISAIPGVFGAGLR